MRNCYKVTSSHQFIRYLPISAVSACYSSKAVIPPPFRPICPTPSYERDIWSILHERHRKVDIKRGRMNRPTTIVSYPPASRQCKCCHPTSSHMCHKLELIAALNRSPQPPASFGCFALDCFGCGLVLVAAASVEVSDPSVEAGQEQIEKEQLLLRG